jgi:hypothetical protein
MLENKTHDSKREMDILDALEEIRNINKRNAMITSEELLANISKEENNFVADMTEEERGIYLQLEENKEKKIKRIIINDEDNSESTYFTKPKTKKIEDSQTKNISEKKPLASLITFTKKAAIKLIAKEKEAQKKIICNYSDDEEKKNAEF